MEAIKILHIESNQQDSELILAEMERNKMFVAYTCITSEKELAEAIVKDTPDIILADYQLLGFNGVTVLEICNHLCPDIPFIFISGPLGDERAVELLKYGASDFIFKQDLTQLVPAIKYALKQKKLEKEKQNAEQLLAQSEKKYRNIFETMQDIFCKTDMVGKVLDVSPSLERITGYSPSEIINRDIRVLYGVVEDLCEIVTHLKEFGELWDYETTMICKDGMEKYVSINAHLSYNEKMQPVAIESIIRDISVRKNSEMELIAARERAEQSDRLKTAFLANISHEIRTPMNGILGFSQVLRDAEFDNDIKAQVIASIEESGIRMLNIINQIIDISVIESGEKRVEITKVNIDELVDAMYALFYHKAEAKHLELYVTKPSRHDSIFIDSDREKLQSIFTTLIGNAIKFTKTGGVSFGYKKRGTIIEFFVKDTGIGIAEGEVEYIFDSFYQVERELVRNYEGAGLGLSICRAYVQMLRGKIWVESSLGEGTVFYFALPLTHKQTGTDERKKIEIGREQN